MSDTLLFILIAIGVLVAMIASVLIIYINEKKYREEIVDYYENLIEKQDESIKLYRQKIKRLKTKINFYQTNNEDI